LDIQFTVNWSAGFCRIDWQSWIYLDFSWTLH